MKLIARTRWEYYVANVAGILAILGLLGWFIAHAFTDAGIDFKSVFFWLALLVLVALPFPLISFFSSMKTVEVTKTGLIISYVFQKHQNAIHFSDITAVNSSRTDQETRIRPRTIRETFRLVLSDGRAFEFDRSQFSQYYQLKAICLKNINVTAAPSKPVSPSTTPDKKRGR